MPVNKIENLTIYTECLGTIESGIEEVDSTEVIYILGDCNAHPRELIFNELIQFCEDQSWECTKLDF